jgi:hypothetical protein
MTAQGDFNDDGYLDLLLHFRTQDLQLTPSSTEAVLYGETFSGQRLRGADSVRVVPFQPPARAIRNRRVLRSRTRDWRALVFDQYDGVVGTKGKWCESPPDVSTSVKKWNWDFPAPKRVS